MKQDKKTIRANFNNVCMKRDCYRCVTCDGRAELVVHHITDRHFFLNGGYVKENGITLCDKCHWKAERFHRTTGKHWEIGFHPNELYIIIQSSKKQAIEADTYNV